MKGMGSYCSYCAKGTNNKSSAALRELLCILRCRFISWEPAFCATFLLYSTDKRTVKGSKEGRKEKVDVYKSGHG